jgi:hypothetical protein
MKILLNLASRNNQVHFRPIKIELVYLPVAVPDLHSQSHS